MSYDARQDKDILCEASSARLRNNNDRGPSEDKVEYIGNMDVIFHGKSDKKITLIDVAYIPDL